MEIQVRHGIVLVDDADTHLVYGYSWFSTKRRNTFYARAWDGGYKTGKMVYMHRLLAGEAGMQVDHINGNGLDNRRENLRAVTQSQNLANQRKTRGTSKYKGVSLNNKNKKWISQIQKDGITYRLGCNFETEHEAAIVYNTMAFSLFGEHAKLNEIEYASI